MCIKVADYCSLSSKAMFTLCQIAFRAGGGRGGEGAPLEKPYRCVPPQRVGVFAPFWSENGYTFCPFWSGIGYVFREKYGSV